MECTKDTFKKRWYNYRSSFKLESHRCCTTLTSHVCEFQKRCNRSPGIRWSVLRRLSLAVLMAVFVGCVKWKSWLLWHTWTDTSGWMNGLKCCPKAGTLINIPWPNTNLDVDVYTNIFFFLTSGSSHSFLSPLLLIILLYGAKLYKWAKIVLQYNCLPKTMRQYGWNPGSVEGEVLNFLHYYLLHMFNFVEFYTEHFLKKSIHWPDFILT